MRRTQTRPRRTPVVRALITLAGLAGVASVDPPARAQATSAPSVTVHDSAITTASGAPYHLLLRVRNPTARPVVVRVVSAKYLPPSGRPVALERLATTFLRTPGPGPITLAPGSDAEGTLTFRYATRAEPGTLESYQFEVRLRIDGRETVARARVVRMERLPWRSP